MKKRFSVIILSSASAPAMAHSEVAPSLLHLLSHGGAFLVLPILMLGLLPLLLRTRRER